MALALATALWASLAWLARAGVYDLYTTTGLIPFLEADEPGLGFGENVHVRAYFGNPAIFGTRSLPLYVDTGSCGVILSARDLPGWTGMPPVGAQPGWHYLSSSKTLYNGWWIPTDLFFIDNPANTTTDLPGYIRTRSPVLAVTTSFTCRDYDLTTHGPSCLGSPVTTTPDPPGIRIMGLGFGREHDGQPQGTPDKNPLLHVASIASRTQPLPPVQTGTFWPGYVLGKAGIAVGLTASNTASMTFARLDPAGSATAQHWTDLDTVSWPELAACLKITAPGVSPGAATPCEDGNAVLDLGIGTGFVRVQHDDINDPLPRSEDEAKLLHTGTHVQVRFGPAVPGAPSAHFVVGMSAAGDPRPVTPESVRAVYAATGGGRGTFINTSRYIFRKYIVAFDPVLGRMGFRLTPVAGGCAGC